MLKKAMLVAGIAVAAAGSAMAQSTPWQAGLTAGVALTNVSADDLEDNDSKLSPYFGVSLVFQPEGPLGFETGAIYISKGFSGEAEGAEADFNLDYIEVPLLARYALTMSGSSIRPVIMAGAAIGFNTGCEVEGESGGVSISLDCEEVFGVGAKSIDIGPAVRVAVDIPVGTRTIISPSARYTHGLTNILDDDEDDATNRAFVFGVSGRIRL